MGGISRLLAINHIYVIYYLSYIGLKVLIVNLLILGSKYSWPIIKIPMEKNGSESLCYMLCLTKYEGNTGVLHCIIKRVKEVS